MNPTVSQQFPHPVRALGQDLICVLRRERHCREHPAQEIGAQHIFHNRPCARHPSHTAIWPFTSGNDGRTRLTPTERSANQGRSFAAVECTAYLSVVWRAVDVDGHGDELPPGPPMRPRGAVLGIPWVPVTVHSDSGTSLAPSRFNSTLYPSLLSWLTVSAAAVPP